MSSFHTHPLLHKDLPADPSPEHNLPELPLTMKLRINQAGRSRPCLVRASAKGLSSLITHVHDVAFPCSQTGTCYCGRIDWRHPHPTLSTGQPSVQKTLHSSSAHMVILFILQGACQVPPFRGASSDPPRDRACPLQGTVFALCASLTSQLTVYCVIITWALVYSFLLNYKLRGEGGRCSPPISIPGMPGTQQMALCICRMELTD